MFASFGTGLANAVIRDKSRVHGKVLATMPTKRWGCFFNESLF